MRTIYRAGVAAGLALLHAAIPAKALDYKVGDLVIEQPWARATPKGAQVAGGYLSVTNHGATPDRLTGGAFEAASTFELHEMTTENGIMKMRPVGPLEIPAGGTLKLAPAGKHIMLAGLKHGLKKGETVAGTLTFERSGTVPVRFTVEDIGAKEAAGIPVKSGHEGHSMPGMDMH